MIRSVNSIIFLSLIILTSCSEVSTDRPNVILILTDDQGSVDVNAYGASDLATPNLDRLINEGVRFTRFYVGSAVCSPSRAAILTGRTPHSAGVPGNVSSIPGNKGMPLEQVTMAELFKEEGYTTGHIGKWHLGYSDETTPLAQGFDYSFGHMGGCIDNYSHFFYWNGPNRHDLWENGEEIFSAGKFFPDMMLSNAENFIKRQKNEPFFLYYALNIPHYPLQPTEKWREYYKDMEMPRRDYAGFVSTADENIGALINILEENNLRENTIIIFMSDHGHSYETRTFGGGGSSGPLRGGKTSLFDGGIRVPATISWKGNIPGGAIRNQIVHSIDLLPTVAALCGINKIPDNVEGIDISNAILNNEELDSRALYWKLGSQWAVRKDNWKLIGLPRDPSGKLTLDKEKDRLFLSSMLTDSTETINLAGQYPEIVKDLINEYLKWPNASIDDIPEEIGSLENRAMGAKVSLSVKPSPNYSSIGPATLTDNKAGSRSHSDGFWLGFETDDLEALLDMGKAISINEVSVRFLNGPENWIFAPEYITLAFSTDGKNWSKPEKIDLEPDIRNLKVVTPVYRKATRARYIKLFAKNIGQNPEWHNNPGGKAWIFCDEIIIK